VGRIEKRKVSSAAERLDAVGLGKYDSLANSRIILPYTSDFLTFPLPLLTNKGIGLRELFRWVFFIVVTFCISIGLKESPAGVADEFDVEISTSARVEPILVSYMSLALYIG